LHFTGDPLFSRLWTLLGSPCVSVPLAWTAEGLPVALQLVAAPHRDRDVLGAARYLLDRDG
jgi:Asp-tRNA(Asn)/Glu-tRNA(Gln) amidotransferase A subunit family amidase